MIRLAHLVVLFSLITFTAFSSNPVDSLKTIVASKPLEAGTIDWLNDVSYSYWSQDPQITEQLSTHALQLATNMSYEKGIANSNHLLGIAFEYQDQYDKSLEHYLIALTHYENLGELRGIANINMNIGNVHDGLGDYDKAMKYGLKALEIHQQRGDSAGMAKSYNNLGIIYKHNKQVDASLDAYRHSIAIRKALNDTIGQARIINNIAVIQLDQERFAEAIKSLNESRILLLGSPEEHLIGSLYANYGKAYTGLKQHELAKTYLDSCLAVAKKTSSLYKEQLAYEYLKQDALARGDKSDAFKYLQKEFEVDNSRRSEQVQTQIESLEAKYEHEKQARQLAILEKEQAKKAAFNLVLIISSIAILLIAMFLVVTMRLKIKNGKLRERELKTELEQKNKELTSYTLNFIQKNELMTELTDSINSLKKQADPGIIRELSRLTRIIDSNFRIDQEWENFKLMFEEVHKSFFINLRKEHPNLGNAEVKLCALSRLSLNLKESASVLGISVDSVKTARYRLRKKLGLKTEESLSDFLLRFDGETSLSAA